MNGHNPLTTPANGGDRDVKVSVLMTTYNQEKFVAEAINSILMQKVNFAYEIIVGEDASTDRTREIVLELQQQSPDKIRPLLRDKASAEHDRARGLGGKTAFVEGLRACRGQYIALLDGDDYWTDERKLQMQVDFLDAQPDYALCFHNAAILRPNGAPGTELVNPPDQKETSTLEDLLEGNFIFTGSVMFRGGLLPELPAWFHTSKVGDWLLHILNAQYGKIKYFSEVMATYRMHQKSFWSSRPLEQQLGHMIEFLGLVNPHLDFKYHDRCASYVRQLQHELSYIYVGKFHTSARAGRPMEATHWLVKAIKYHPKRFTDPRQIAYLAKSYVLSVVRNAR